LNVANKIPTAKRTQPTEPVQQLKLTGEMKLGLGLELRLTVGRRSLIFELNEYEYKYECEYEYEYKFE